LATLRVEALEKGESANAPPPANSGGRSGRREAADCEVDSLIMVGLKRRRNAVFCQYFF
jgi:hypothetical protein